MSKSTESIFDGKDVLIPLAEVNYILKFPNCIEVHFKGSAESVTLVQPDQNALISAWCRYRSEVDADTLMDLGDAHPTQIAQDESVRKAWVRFSNAIVSGDDAPYPGMSEAFEQHFSQSFTDREWRAESATWAAAWKAAKRHGAQPAPSAPEVTDAMAIAFHCALTDVSIGEHAVEEIKKGLRAALAAAPEAKL